MPKIILFGDDHADPMCTKFLIQQLDSLSAQGYTTFFYESYVDPAAQDKISTLIAEKQDILDRFALFPNGDIPNLVAISADQMQYLLEKFIPEMLSIDYPNWRTSHPSAQSQSIYCQDMLHQPHNFETIKTRIKERWVFMQNRIDTVPQSIKLLEKIRDLGMRLVPMDRPSTETDSYNPQQRQAYMLNNIITNLTDHAIIFVGAVHLIDHWHKSTGAYNALYVRGMVRRLKNHPACNELSTFFCTENPLRYPQVQSAIATCSNEIVDAIQFIKLAGVNLDAPLLDLETIASPHLLFGGLRVFPTITSTSGILLTVYIQMIDAYNSFQDRLNYAEDLCGAQVNTCSYSGQNFTCFNIDSSKLDHVTILSYLFLKMCEYDKAQISQAVITRNTQSKPITAQDWTGKYRLFMSQGMGAKNNSSTASPPNKP